MDVVQVVISGILLGGVYALFATGLNLIFGVMKIINLGHGELMMLGAYITFFLFSSGGVNPLVAIPIAAVAMAALGWFLQITMVERVVNQPAINSLLLTFGLSTLMMGVALNLWTSNFRSIAYSPLTGSWDLFGIAFSKSRLVAFIIAMFVTSAMWLFLKRSTFGKSIRATSQHPQVAQLCGIDVRRVRFATFALGSGMAAISGALIAMIFTISPEMGRMFIGKGFAIIVLGGLGSFVGAFIGAIVLGVSETLTAFFTDTQIAEGVAYLILLLVLVIRPSGFFGKAED
jgi:branched-chain amino acid transport system permease protein